MQNLLKARGLEIFLGISAAFNLENNTNIAVGELLPTGTVIGFHIDESDPDAPLRAIVYDENKGDDDSALTIIKCTF